MPPPSPEQLKRERERLQDTAVDLARWQGGVDANLVEHDNHLEAINGSIAKLAQGVTDLVREVTILNEARNSASKLKAAFLGATLSLIVILLGFLIEKVATSSTITLFGLFS